MLTKYLIRQQDLVLSVASIGTARIINQISPILIVIIFSKLVSTSILGNLNTVIASLVILPELSDLGISYSIVRYAKEKTVEISSIIVLRIISSILLTTVGIILALILQLDLIAVLVILCIIFSVGNTFMQYYVARLDHKTVFFIQLITNVIFFTGSFVLYYLADLNPSISVVASRLISFAIQNVFLFVKLIKDKVLVKRFIFDSELLKLSRDLYWFQIVEKIINNFDVIYISVVLSDFYAGIYKPAGLIALAPMFFGTLISAPLLPILIKTKLKEDRIELIDRLLKILICTLILFSGIIIIGGKLILSTAFTHNIGEYGYITMILLTLASSLYVLTMPVHELMIVNDRNSIIRNVSTLRIIFFILLLLIGLTVKNINQVALSLLIIYFVHFLIYFKYYKTWKNT